MRIARVERPVLRSERAQAADRRPRMLPYAPTHFYCKKSTAYTTNRRILFLLKILRERSLFGWLFFEVVDPSRLKNVVLKLDLYYYQLVLYCLVFFHILKLYKVQRGTIQ